MTALETSHAVAWVVKEKRGGKRATGPDLHQ